MSLKWLEWAKQIQALAQAGLTYTTDPYDKERYRELRDISSQIMAQYSESDLETVKNLFANETGYQTPKVDIRAVVFKHGKILLVQEKADQCWALPGGWADIGLSPSEVAVKEVKEESGYEVKATRLLAVLDKKYYLHPPSPYHTYKIFIQCDLMGGVAKGGLETQCARFFGEYELPPLSSERNTTTQLKLLFEYYKNTGKFPLID